MNCRSPKRRQNIVENYKVVPIAHIKLLAGQTKRSDAGATIENEYYIFEVTREENGEEKKDYIQCGMGAARDFLCLLNHKGLPLFNPLHNHINARYAIGVDGGQQGVNQNNNNNWDPTAQQLYNAIMWLIIAWDAEPGTRLFDLRDEAIKYKSHEPFDWRVSRINEIIRKDRNGRTLTQIVNGFRVNNNIRNDMCEFDRLTAIIEGMTDENGNHLISYF